VPILRELESPEDDRDRGLNVERVEDRVYDRV
jgi:hypothetical protein